MTKKMQLSNNDNLLDLKELHSPEGIYDNWKEAIEDIYTFISSQTRAITKIAEHVTNLADQVDNIISVYNGIDKDIDRRLNSFGGDINKIKGDISTLQSRIKGINDIGPR